LTGEPRMLPADTIEYKLGLCLGVRQSL
jgi:hypothetical protein